MAMLAFSFFAAFVVYMLCHKADLLDVLVFAILVPLAGAIGGTIIAAGVKAIVLPLLTQ